MPWNFPLVLLMNKLGPALVAGNSMVVKPAPTTPLTTLLFGELCRDLLPAGVVNIICDENDLGPALTSHPDVAKVAFTGSTATGKKVMQSAATSVKRVTLELGGNDGAIVLDDVDPVAVAHKVFQGAMTNAGQICVAIKRAYVPEALYDTFSNELARLAKEAVVDDGTNQGVQIGPVQNRMQFEKLKEILADAREKGTVLAGGAALDRPGYFIAPTIVGDLPDDARLVCEEQFGPVLPVLKYKDLNEVIERTNNSEYGLGATIWGRDLDRAMAVAKRIDSGTVWVNQALAIDPAIPFRGSKQSGLGAELGEDGLHEFTQAHIINAVSLDAA
jgi:acyl-CoA reductase-like NAD-dependent aldehyde dehydrogenase